MEQYKPGDVVWTDLTIPNAEEVKDFYSKVTGWGVDALSMGDYDDYVMKNTDGTAVAGVCHARGSNAHIPPQWLVYVTVADVQESIANCNAMGGKVLDGRVKWAVKILQ